MQQADHISSRTDFSMPHFRVQFLHFTVPMPIRRRSAKLL